MPELALMFGTLLLGLLLIPQPSFSRAKKIDFEGLTPADIVAQVFGDLDSGPVGVRGTNPALGMSDNAAVVFDTDNPTPQDLDLGAPN